MPGVAAAAAWTLYALVAGKRTTCAFTRAVARHVPGGRWIVLGTCVWFTGHLCRPLFGRGR